ncbi:MAG: aromatic amino acid transport family protein [Desulfovibrionales bacterium]
MKTTLQFFRILGFSFLVVGNLIGVGILALPVNTGLAGLLPALSAMLVLGGMMFFSALVLSREAVISRRENFNYPTLYEKYLGAAGKWVAILANMLILYGLLVAYITGGTTILANLFHLPEGFKWLLTIGFFAVITSVALMKTGLLVKYNSLIMLVLFVFFLLMTVIGEFNLDVENYEFNDWSFLIATAPIIVTAFHFHNIIPNICSGLKWDFSAIWKSILIGMVIGYGMNAVWIQVGIGVLPLEGSADSLLEAFHKNLPATVPMSGIIGSSAFMLFSICFSLLAIMTSYLANSMGLMGFIKDMTENHLNLKGRAVVVGATFLPPLVISLVWPQIFLEAINIVGGVGIVVLFGILPGIIYIRKADGGLKKGIGWAILIVFVLCLVFEIGQEAGLLHIQPHVEHYAPQVEHIRQ